jgi:alpha-glucosidase
MSFDLIEHEDGFDLSYAGRLLLRHRLGKPCLSVAQGQESVAMYRGNFRIEDTRTPPITPLYWHKVANSGPSDRIEFLTTPNGEPVAALDYYSLHGAGYLHARASDSTQNRLSLHFHAEVAEQVWGGGEQMSYLDLRGRAYPMWTSEPGVGRDKSTSLTRAMDQLGMAGGDYWHTNYPQPTFLSSQVYALHLTSTAYSVLDFTRPDQHVIEVWEGAALFECHVAPTLVDLVSALSLRFGRQPSLPDWAIGGAIIGLKDGANSLKRLETILDAGTAVSGLWCEDWVGIRQTSFGRRLFWDWRWQPQRYPDLPAVIASLRKRGIRFLGYVNPYIAADAGLYAEGVAGGHFARALDSDDVALVDFGEFDCAVVDFTRPETCAWFAERVIGQNMLDFGLSGWMADFGEYLPTNIRLADGSSPMLRHNEWPVLWAKVNADAVASRGQTGEAVFFMRAGFSGVQAHCPLLWAGDQSVDFTRHDGIGTVITAALSSGLLGNAYSHSDVGGYTSVLDNRRSAELLMRWSELGAFCPVMRTHEGNRPTENLQIDASPEILSHFAAMSRVHLALAPYVRSLCDEAVATGLPAQRPLFLHYPDEAGLGALQDQFLYGRDLLVAPVIVEGARHRVVRLPGQEPWVHVWTGRQFAPGLHEVPAPLGAPPAFYRAGSDFAAVFQALPSALDRGDKPRHE